MRLTFRIRFKRMHFSKLHQQLQPVSGKDSFCSKLRVIVEHYRCILRFRKEERVSVDQVMILLFLSVCGVKDLKEKRVPNWAVLVFFAAGLGIKSQGFTVLDEKVFYYLFSCGLIPAVCIPLFLLRMIGAGDLKAAGIICGYLGIRDGITVILCGLAAAFFACLWKSLRTGGLYERMRYLFCYIKAASVCLVSGHMPEPYYNRERDGAKWVVPLTFYFFLGGLFTAAYRLCR